MIKDWKNLKVSNDTRTLNKGEYYVPVKGENFDGHSFIDEAKSKGAAGIIEEEELYKFAKKKLLEFKPIVIGVTGSTGKTTVKEAIATVLSEKYKVAMSSKNFNTKLGLSLDVMNNLTSEHKVFVAEMGMDRINEIKEMCEVVKPDIAVITSINETHLEKLGTLENIIKAKGEILEALTKDSFGVLNFDDDHVLKLRTTGAGKKVFYSATMRSDFFATDIEIGTPGTSFTLNAGYPGLSSGRLKVETPLLGKHSVYISLAAAVASAISGLSLSEIKRGLAKLHYPKGRLNILKGINRSILIDDTYNSSPASSLAALEVLRHIKGGRKIAILGDMLELGTFEEEGHRKVGRKLAEMQLDLLVAVGSRVRYIADAYSVECIASNMKPNVLRYETSENALSDLVTRLNLKENDVILVKGSQGMRMEKISYLLMEEKGLAQSLLVRQEASWK